MVVQRTTFEVSAHILYYSQPAYLHFLLCFHTPARSLRSSNTNLLTVSFARTALGARIASLSHLLLSGTLSGCFQFCDPPTVPTLSARNPRLISSSKPFHSPRYSISLLAPQIRHLLTLCAFINFICLLTCILWHKDTLADNSCESEIDLEAWSVCWSCQKKCRLRRDEAMSDQSDDRHCDLEAVVATCRTSPVNLSAPTTFIPAS